MKIKPAWLALAGLLLLKVNGFSQDPSSRPKRYWMSKIRGLTEVMVKQHVKSLSPLPDQNHDKI